MDELHITNMDAIRKFVKEFQTFHDGKRVCISNMSTSISEICVWIDSCEEVANREKEYAEEIVYQCEQNLEECRSQEDEDYCPDCSSEEQAFEDSLIVLKMWENRCATVKNIRLQLQHLGNRLSKHIDDYNLKSAQRFNQGIKYLSDQIIRMEHILALNENKRS